MIVTAYSKQQFTILSKTEETARGFKVPIDNNDIIQELWYLKGTSQNSFHYQTVEDSFALRSNAPFQILSGAVSIPHGLIMAEAGEIIFGNFISGQFLANEVLATLKLFSAPIEMAWGEKFRRTPVFTSNPTYQDYFLNFNGFISSLNLPDELYSKTYDFKTIIKIDVDSRLIRG